ncbi:MAG: hypothetical protein IJ466_02065 [Clostridia bacterium]|nr:hypothetical protein [Clostridia bacterium]
MKKRNLKLLTMVLAVALSVTAIVSGTVAYFTDTVSTEEQVTSGNLDVTLEYFNKETNEWVTVKEQDYNPADKADTTWVDKDSNANLFKDNALYEPGYTEYVQVRVKNAGDLALQYKLGLRAANTQAGINVYDDPFYLSDYLMVGSVKCDYEGEVPGSREEVWTNYGGKYITPVDDSADETATGTIYTVELMKDQELLPSGATNYHNVALWMPTDVTNVANHKTGTAKPTIALGVTLDAAQYTHESDSFSDQYDAGATYTDNTAGGTNVVTNYAPEEYSDFAFYIDKKTGEAGVQFYRGATDKPSVPNYINYDGKTYPVTAIYNEGAFGDYTTEDGDTQTITEVSLPSTITDIYTGTFPEGVTLNLASGTVLNSISWTAFGTDVRANQGTGSPLVTINYAGTKEEWDDSDNASVLEDNLYKEGEDYVLLTSNGYDSSRFAHLFRYNISTAEPVGGNFSDWTYTKIDTDSDVTDKNPAFELSLNSGVATGASVVTMPESSTSVYFNTENPTALSDTQTEECDYESKAGWTMSKLTGTIPNTVGEVRIPDYINEIGEGVFAKRQELRLIVGENSTLRKISADMFTDDAGEGVFYIVFADGGVNIQSNWKNGHVKMALDNAGFVEGVDYYVLFPVVDTENVPDYSYANTTVFGN